MEAARPHLLEVTTWTPVDDLRRYRALTEGEPLLLHAGNLLGTPLNDLQVAELRALVRHTDAPWLSVHISLWPWETLRKAHDQGRRPTALDLGSHLEDFFARVRSLRESLEIPLLLENAPGLPGMQNDPESDPITIAAVLEATGCPFLLDLSYAQTAAANWGFVDPRRYLERLPLDRIVEVHLSAPRRLQDGRLIDAHEPTREEDHDLLQWLLKRAHPEVVTLEYWKDSNALLEQIVRLKTDLGWNG